MEKLFKNSKRWMTAFGVAAFLMVAGWQVGADGTHQVFTETEVALENAIEGSGGGIECYQIINECWIFGCSKVYRCIPGGTCETERADDWSNPGSC